MQGKMFRRLMLSGIALYFTGNSIVAQAQAAPDGTIARIGSSDLNGQSVTNPDGTISLFGEQTGNSWLLAWNMTLNLDPSIAGTLTLTNLSTTTTNNYNLLFSLPVSPGFSPSVFGGSLSATLTDANNSGSASMGLIGAGNGSMYNGLINGLTSGSSVLQLFALSDLTCLGSGGSGGCTATHSESAGLPGLTLPGPGVTSSIGTLLSFSLTAGDSVTFATNFVVEPAPVPVPAALPLMLAGLGGLGLLRRRARAAATA